MVSSSGSGSRSAVAVRTHGDQHPLVFLAALVCLIWYLVVIFVTLLGYTQLWRHYFKQRPRSKSSVSTQAPHVSIIRPVKGLEPNLYDCLAATFRQDYPADRLSVSFCVSDPDDPAVPIMQTLLSDFPTFDARLLVEAEDDVVRSPSFGPNPKIRNMSRAYREAKGDLIWIIDCNVWVAKGTLGRMVDTLQGTPAKFVHLLPLVVDVTKQQRGPEAAALLSDGGLSSTNTSGTHDGGRQLDCWQYGGGRLEELFMSSSHAKFYTAINTVLVAPCIVGKSTMFRKSHLDALTDGRGIDYFSENICEDHLIGDLLWRKRVPEEVTGQKWAKHAMVFGDFAIQPMAGMSVSDYIARRVRWLRVRKFTVMLATLVEPGTESFLCSAYGAFAAATFGLIQPTLLSGLCFWLTSVAAWCALDRTLYLMLHSGTSITVDENTPDFCTPPPTRSRRPFKPWLLAWLGREALALPIWVWAVYGGASVVWRGKRFRVGLDMKVHEIPMSKRKRHD